MKNRLYIIWEWLIGHNAANEMRVNRVATGYTPTTQHEHPFGNTKTVLIGIWNFLSAGNTKHPSNKFYIAIATSLTVITIVEVVLFGVYMPRSLFIALMLILSLFKFALVTSFFMHLRFDHRAYITMFSIGMFFGLTLYVALIIWIAFFGFNPNY